MANNTQPEHITVEKKCINNFLDHYELFVDEAESRYYAGALEHKEIVHLYTAYLNQRRIIMTTTQPDTERQKGYK